MKVNRDGRKCHSEMSLDLMSCDNNVGYVCIEFDCHPAVDICNGLGLANKRALSLAGESVADPSGGSCRMI